MDLTNLNKERKRRKNPLELSPMMYGKVPPQARDLEEAVLGACLIVRDAFDLAIEILRHECFYVDANQRIFRSMQVLAQKNMPIDILTVIEELRFTEDLDLVGGPYYVTKLTEKVTSSANIETHCRLVLQKFIQRELIRISGEIIGDAYEDSTDVFDLLNDAESKLASITQNHLKKDFSKIEKVVAVEINKIEELRLKDEHVTGVHTGYTELDRITHGWQPTDLIVLAARPSVGKTAYALNLARNAALHPISPVPVGFFSLEMSEGQLVRRLLSMQSYIWLDRLLSGKLEEYHMLKLYQDGVTPICRSNIVIDDTPALNIFEFRARARRMKNKYRVGMIIIDYLQLMSSTSKNRNNNRENDISEISRNLKAIAKDLNVPIIALSQLSREVEKRASKIPQLSDLRESGAIEQDADMVMFLYRPDKEDILKQPDLKGTASVKIAKHRNGALDEIAFEVKDEIQKWSEVGTLSSNWQPVNNLERQYTPKSDFETF